MQNKVAKKVEFFLIKNQLTDKKHTFVMGLSGGADSLCLLNILNSLSKKYHFRIIACHLNHNWRRESFDEQKRAENYCNENNIEFHTETLPNDLARTETVAREERYKFFERCAEKFKTGGVFTAHTKDDNAETILYRIAKGTGLRGMMGIPYVIKKEDVIYYRPLLDVSKGEILDYCEKKSLSPSFDSSNLDTKYLRNFLRLEIIPEIEKNINEDFKGAILRLSAISKDYEHLADEYLESIKAKIYKNNTILTAEFEKLSEPLKRVVLRDFLIEFEPSFEKTHEILAFVEEAKKLPNGRTFSLARDKFLFVSKKQIRIITRSISNVAIQNNSDLACRVIISPWQAPPPTEFPKDTDMTAFVDLSGFDDIEIRTRKAGDVIQPLGMMGRMKLKKYLINKAIPEHERDNLILIAVGNEILWVAGVGISDKIKVKRNEFPSHKLEIINENDNE